MTKILSRLCGSALLLAASLQTHAQGFVYDQQSATNGVSIYANNVDGLDIQPAPLTQSFTPSLSAIGFVQFQFWDVPLINNGNNGATVYVRLWTGSPNPSFATLLGSTTPVYMPDGFQNPGLGGSGVTNFYFSTPIALAAGQTYYLQPVVLSGDNPWDIITIGNTYPNGQLFVRGAGFSTDMWFREGVVTPEPSSLALVGLSGLLIFMRKRFRNFLLILGLSLVGIAHADVYYLQSYGGIGTAPFPINPYGNSVPVAQISQGVYLVEDVAPARATSISRAMSNVHAINSASKPLSLASDGSQSAQPNGYSPMIYTSGLWLEIVNTNPVTTNLWLRLHGT